MTLASFGTLLDGSPDPLVACRGADQINFSQFRADVASAANAFASIQQARLFCEDAYLFIVGLFGLLYAGADIVLPPHQKFVEGGGIPIGDVEIREACSRPPIRLPLLDTSRLAMTFYTSGSTGAPKPIIKNLKMFEDEITLLHRAFPMPEGKVFATVSHQHVYGLTFKLLWPLMARQVFEIDIFDLWEPLLEALIDGDILVTSPSHLERLEGIAPAKYHLSRIFSAGAPLSLTASLAAADLLGCRPIEIFGSTETGAIATRRQTHKDIPWSALPETSVSAGDGRLTVQTPHSGGVHIATGDLVEIKENGFMLRGRADRIAKIEGKRIHLSQVEEALVNLPWIRDAAAVVISEGSRLGAVLVLSSEGSEKLEQLGKFRFGRMLRHEMLAQSESAAIPRSWRYLDHLPTQNMGKRKSQELKALFGEDK